MSDKKSKTVGRITLFHVEGGVGSPKFSGYIENEDGTRNSIYLYSEPNDKVTNKEILKGPVYLPE
jgi:hypothetical protein